MAGNDFGYVDTAVGGAHNRNHVKRIDGFNPPPGSRDCYTTYLRFTEDLIAYMQAHPNKDGKPSVSGYPGPALALCLPFDLDCEQDPTRALTDARRVVQHWMVRYEIPAKAIRVYFSGCKGFSIELPATLFGGFEPSVDVAERLKRLALRLGENAETLDTTIYEKLRLWRWPNTINAKTGLYKIPLTVEELLTFDLAGIRVLAASPRQIAVPSDDEWTVTPELQALWAETAIAERKGEVSSRDARADLSPARVLQGVPQGQRDQTLFRYACSLRAQGRDRAEAEILVLAAARKCDPPFPEAEAMQKVENAWAYPVSRQSEGEHLTDVGNARRLVARHGNDLRYVNCWKKWLVWDGRRWRMDDTGEVARRAKETIQAIYAEAASLSDDGARQKLVKHALASEAAPSIAAMVRLAESEAEIAARSDDFDRDLWLLNVENGTVDLRAGQLRPHQREDLVTKLAPVECRADAACPTFEAFLAHIFAGDRDLIGFVQRGVGYSLTGDVSERVLFILHGVGANGKTTFLEAQRAALGDYAMRTPTETLLVKREGSIPNDVARLMGARFVTASEAEDGKRLAEAQVKEMTGGDMMTARFMRAEFFEFRPQFKLWLATNHKPVIRGTDKGIWDRLRLVPFNIRIPDDQQDKQLLAKLRDELPGILRWAIEGCVLWQKDGLGIPSAVQEATEGYREEMDVLGRFIEECCLVQPTTTVKSSDLYTAYKKWCEENREFAITQKAFSMRLTERGFQKRKHDTGAWWYGLGLLTGCASLTGSDGSSSMNDMNTSRIALYEKTHQNPSDPSGESPGQSDGTYLPAEGIGSADDLYEKRLIREKPWLRNAATGESKRPKIAWTRTGTDK